MGLEKGIRHGKEHRRDYRGSKSFDVTCRNHGSCKWCERNRTSAARKITGQEATQVWFDEAADMAAAFDRLQADIVGAWWTMATNDKAPGSEDPGASISQPSSAGHGEQERS